MTKAQSMTKDQLSEYIAYDKDKGEFYRMPNYSVVIRTRDGRIRLNGVKYTLGTIASILMGAGDPHPHRMQHLDGDIANYKWENLMISSNKKKDREALGLGTRGHTKRRMVCKIQMIDDEEWYPCSSCGKLKPLDVHHFQKDSSTTLGWKGTCKSCISDRRTKESKDPKVIKAKSEQAMLKKYGLTMEAYITRYEAQDGKCDICGSKGEKQGMGFSFTDVLVIDHCHDSGHVRGLLCQHCNRSIGLLKDNAEILRKAADYLDKDRDNAKT